MLDRVRVLAWRIPETEEPSGGLPSMGLHRVRQDWSNLAAESEFKSSLLWFCIRLLLFLLLHKNTTSCDIGPQNLLSQTELKLTYFAVDKESVKCRRHHRHGSFPLTRLHPEKTIDFLKYCRNLQKKSQLEWFLIANMHKKNFYPLLTLLKQYLGYMVID